MGKNRVEALSDGRVRDCDDPPRFRLQNECLSLSSGLTSPASPVSAVAYVLSFVVLGVYWVAHTTLISTSSQRLIEACFGSTMRC